MEYQLRPWNINDLNSLLKYANNRNIAKYMTDRFPHPYTQEAGEAFIAFSNQNKPVNMLAIEINGEAVGGIGIHPQTDVHCKNAELGYWLGEPFQGKGIITSAVPEMVEFGFNNYDITRIFGRVYGSNIASQKVLEKCGFALEAHLKNTICKFDRFEDEMIYAIRRYN